MSRPPRRPSHAGKPRRRPEIGKINRGLPSVRCHEPPSAALLQGIAEFNQGRFFEQHETLEDAWIEETDPIRYLYQGILQVGVGFHHLNRRNFRGAHRLMERGLRLLQPFAPACMGVDVARFIDESERAYAHLLALGADQLDAFDRSLIPRVHLLSERAETADGDA